MEKVLFVCTGNTCRSSMAKGIFDFVIKERGLGEKFKSESAGTDVYVNVPASDNAVTALKKRGIDISSNLSKQVTEDMIKNADVVLTMGKTHKDYLNGKYPKYSDKIYTLLEYARAIEKYENEQFLCEGDKKQLALLRQEINALNETLEKLYKDIEKIQEQIRKKQEEISKIEPAGNKLAMENIPDPFGKDLSVYENTAEVIEGAVEKIIDYISK